jgi:hypothetical protein
MPCASSRKRCRSEHRPTGSGEGAGVVAFRAKARCLNVAYSANCGRDLFHGLSGRRSTPHGNNLCGVQASEPQQAATALDGYE